VSFSFEIQIQSSICFLLLSGTILSKDEFEEVLGIIDEQLEEDQRKFILDLKALDQINSSGLNFILRIFTHIRNKGGDLVLIHANKTVSALFKISKLDTVFNISADKETAINQLNAPEA
jgi:anti-anti-sigma factor